jgi:hypothetical protein
MENEKSTLIFEDTQAAENEVQGMKQLHTAAMVLKEAFELLKLGKPFSKDLFISLLEQGTNILADSAKQAFDQWIKEVLPPSMKGNKINLQPNFSSLHTPIAQVKKIIREYGIDPYLLNFKGTTPEFSKHDEGEIRERHKYFTRTDEDKELYKLTENYCQATNDLEEFIKRMQYPSVVEGFANLNLEYYINITSEPHQLRLIPNYEMFVALKAYTDNFNRKR